MARKTLRIGDLSVDTKYVVQLRGIDDEGTPGKWSSTYSFHTAMNQNAPAQVQGLELAYTEAGTFVLTWEPVTTDESGNDLINLKDYVIEVSNGVITSAPDYVNAGHRYIFTLDMNRAAFGQPYADLEFIIRARTKANVTGPPATISGLIPGPGEIEISARTRVNLIELSWERPTGVLGHYIIYKNDEEFDKVGGDALAWGDGDPGRGPQEYYVRVYDVFGRYSESNTVTEAAIGIDFILDAVAPMPPSNPDYSETFESGDQQISATFSWTAPVLNVDGSDYDDNEGFEVRWRTDPARGWEYIRVPDDRTDGTVAEDFTANATVPMGSTIFWQVRAFDRLSNYSDWVSMDDDPVSGIDDTAPEQPSAALVAGNVHTIQITHDLMDSDGEPLPESVQFLNVHISSTEDFTPNDSTLVEQVPVNGLIRVGGSLVRSFSYPVEDDGQRFVKLVAETAYPAFSQPSEAAGVTVELVKSQHIQDASITNAKISDLDADKLTAGSAVVNDILVRAGLTVDNANGIIKSDNFNYDAKTGWGMDRTGLYVFDGLVEAKAVNIADPNPNLIDHGYTQFSFDPDWYDANVSASSTSGFSVGQSGWWSRYGSNSLRLQNTSNTGRYVYLSPSSTTYNQRVRAGTEHTFSLYAHNNGGSTARFQLSYRANGIHYNVGNEVALAAGETRRIIASFTPAVDNILLAVRSANNSDVLIDGLQLEEGPEASFYKTGGMTSISGGMIKTGSIVSNATTTVNGQTVPTWSLSTAGNLVAYNATISGRIIIGNKDAEDYVSDELAPVDTKATNAQNTANNAQSRADNAWSYAGSAYGEASSAKDPSSWNDGSLSSGISIRSANFNAGNPSSPYNSGWGIYGNGNAYFHNLYARGDIVAESLTSNTTIDSPTITGGTIRTSSDGTRIEISSSSGRVGRVYFYNQTNTNHSWLEQGISHGLQTSSSLRVGLPNYYGGGTATIYTGGMYFGGSTDSHRGYRLTVDGDIHVNNVYAQQVLAEGGYHDTSIVQPNVVMTSEGRLRRSTNLPSGGDNNHSHSFYATDHTHTGMHSHGSGNSLTANNITAYGDIETNGSGDNIIAGGYLAMRSTSSTQYGVNARINTTSGRLQRYSSVTSDKKDIEELDPSYNKVLDLRPVWFRSAIDTDPQDWSTYGMLAEEVNEADPRLTVTDYDSGELISVRYELLGVLLQPYVKKHEKEIKDLQDEIAELRALVGQS